MEKDLDFLVIGVQKSATTSLDQYFRLHPSIAMPNKKKELHFFDKPENLSKGGVFYLPYFKNADTKKIWGECTPIYCYWNGVIDNIYRYNPNIKLILVLRNPVERAFSHWNMEFTHEREHLSFYAALMEEEKRLAKMPHKQHRVYSYLDRGKYVSQINNIWRVFDRKSVHILKMDDLIESPQITLDKINTFLGVSNLSLKYSISAYAGKYNKQMSVKERDYLKSYFYKEILTLEKLLNWDCSEWLEI